MTERPILFSAPMVQGLRAGKKTQTRRTRGLNKINAEPGGAWSLIFDGSDDGDGGWHFLNGATGEVIVIRCPYGVAGDRLWTRETWAAFDKVAITDKDLNFVYYRADDIRKLETDGNWKPSIHMPRWASRDMLEVISARPERLQHITSSDAAAEGCESCTPYDQFRVLWDSINGPGSWAKNPWVWRVEFQRLAR